MTAELEQALCLAVPGNFLPRIVLGTHIDAEHRAPLRRLLIELRFVIHFERRQLRHVPSGARAALGHSPGVIDADADRAVLGHERARERRAAREHVFQRRKPFAALADMARPSARRPTRSPVRR